MVSELSIVWLGHRYQKQNKKITPITSVPPTFLYNFFFKKTHSTHKDNAQKYILNGWIE